jgi:hypothetical protein
MSKIDIERKIKHHIKQRDYYSGTRRAKKLWQGEINKLKKLLDQIEREK